MKDKDNESIKAVHDQQFETFLKSIGVFDDVVNQKCKCKFCRKPISIDNIYTVFAEEKTIKFVCDDMSCVIKMGLYLEEKNRK